MKFMMKAIIKGLAITSKQMRKREQRCLDLGRFNKTKSVSKDRRIPDEAKREASENSDKFYDRYQNLKHRRIHFLRKETRARLVAYGFLNQVPYENIERIHHTEVDWVRVGELILEFGEGGVEMLQAFNEWCNTAVANLSSQKQRQEFEEWFQNAIGVANEPTRKDKAVIMAA